MQASASRSHLSPGPQPQGAPAPWGGGSSHARLRVLGSSQSDASTASRDHCISQSQLTSRRPSGTPATRSSLTSRPIRPTPPGCPPLKNIFKHKIIIIFTIQTLEQYSLSHEMSSLVRKVRRCTILVSWEKLF